MHDAAINEMSDQQCFELLDATTQWDLIDRFWRDHLDGDDRESTLLHLVLDENETLRIGVRDRLRRAWDTFLEGRGLYQDATYRQQIERNAQRHDEEPERWDGQV